MHCRILAVTHSFMQELLFSICRKELGRTVPKLTVQRGKLWRNMHNPEPRQKRRGAEDRAPNAQRRLSSQASVRSVPLQIRQWFESYRIHLDFHFEFFRCVDSVNIWDRFRD